MQGASGRSGSGHRQTMRASTSRKAARNCAEPLWPLDGPGCHRQQNFVLACKLRVPGDLEGRQVGGRQLGVVVQLQSGTRGQGRQQVALLCEGPPARAARVAEAGKKAQGWYAAGPSNPVPLLPALTIFSKCGTCRGNEAAQWALGLGIAKSRNRGWLAGATRRLPKAGGPLPRWAERSPEHAQACNPTAPAAQDP